MCDTLKSANGRYLWFLHSHSFALSSIKIWHFGPRCCLQVVVHNDNQGGSKVSSLLQIGHMSIVQRIEVTRCHDHTLGHLSSAFDGTPSYCFLLKWISCKPNHTKLLDIHHPQPGVQTARLCFSMFQCQIIWQHKNLKIDSTEHHLTGPLTSNIAGVMQTLAELWLSQKQAAAK